MKAFTAAVNAAGLHLKGEAAEARQALYEELPKAMQKVSLMMSALAFED